jgi:type IV fimbrial biogenesis protein FimT
MKKLNKQFGFTLIELMVALAVLAIILSVALPNLRIMIANTQIRSVAESVRNGLQLARAEAVKRNESVRFTLNADGSWQLGCLNVVADLDGDGQADCPAVIMQKGVREGGGNAVTVVGAGQATFTSLGTLVALPAPLAQVNVTSSTSAVGTRPLRITLGVGGNTRMCDPSIVAADDARAC